MGPECVDFAYRSGTNRASLFSLFILVFLVCFVFYFVLYCDLYLVFYCQFFFVLHILYIKWRKYVCIYIFFFGGGAGIKEFHSNRIVKLAVKMSVAKS